ncbi:EF-hand domain-containing protein [Terasakiella sp.]|uniref:EF-hand domain-containing protein n=1 Tax=Terasakiella sp. TaxID=2034861 RepID=UPI003AA89F0A
MDSISSYGSSSALDYARQRREEMFAKIDSDGDGQFTLEEFEAAKPADAPTGGPSSAELFSQMDSDGDGSVSEEEFANAAPPPPPPPGGMMGGGMMSALLEALQESSTTTNDEDDTTTVSSTDDTDESESTSTEEDILELIQKELEQYRNSAYSDASSAYANAANLATLQQQTLASL